MMMKGNDMLNSTEYDFTAYEDIPLDLQGYLTTVADVDNIAELSLDIINDFLVIFLRIC